MMKKMNLNRVFTLIEPGPVCLATTHDKKKDNIMTISWTMALDFSGTFAMMTGEWNHSYKALKKYRECVVAIPTADLLDRVVGIGTCSGDMTDKFAKFHLTPVKAKYVQPPLIKECLANVECEVVEIIKKYNIVILSAVAAYHDASRKEKRLIHAIGDGTFTIDGRRFDRKKQMGQKLPDHIK